jgi:hypothetical protein
MTLGWSDRPRLVEALARGERPAGVRAVARQPFPYATSFPLELITIESGDGATEELVLKRLARHALPSSALAAKPEAVADHRREPWVYERLLAPHGLDGGIYRGSWTSEGAESWLMLARVPGPVLFESGELGDWEAAARLAAEVHALVAPPGDGECPLLQIGAASFGFWLERAQRFARDARASAGDAGALARVADTRERMSVLLTKQPQVLVHGELFASNVLIDEAGESRSPVAIDWEMAAVGPGLVDLAALTAGSLPKGWRLALEAAYRDRSAELGLDLSDADFAEALTCCRLYLAVERLGWAPRSWEPPAAHRQDWLQVASDLVEGLS